ncbi:MAG: NAD-dependent epimerase/dehydratase family protein [Solirubrobacteraceae bacterium]
MSTSLLVLGGSGFVGRAVVSEALGRGWHVATFNRGRSASASPQLARIVGDRLDPATLAPLRERDWDVVVDTWSGAPRAARDSAAVLADHAGHYVYISSGSVYAAPPPVGVDESAETVEASPDAEGGEYPQLKRGAELAVEHAFGDRALLARAGTILGPHEDVGRLPWWLARMAAGGEILAPGPPDLELQLIDARDLAKFALDAAHAHHGGAFNVVSRRGHATMRSLLEACHYVAAPPAARLTWVDPKTVLAAGIEPWTDLPIWLPPDSEFIGMHAANVERAHAAGLRCRPVEHTVQDTWNWLSALGGPPPLRSDVDAPGLDIDRERAALASWHTQTR